MKTYELKRKKGLKSSVYAIALVEFPAIEVGFVALSKDGKSHVVKLAYNEEKRMIYTPVLIPNQKITRKADDGSKFQIFFSEATIEETAQDFIKSGNLVGNFNSEHDSDIKLNGVNVVESWIIDDPKSDKATLLGLDLPKGTWMQGIKIEDDAVWKDVKEGKYKGVSIEGLFENFETNLSNQFKSNIMSEKKFSLGDVITKLMGAENAPDAEVKAEDTKKVEEVKAAMLEDGEYILEDGRKLVIEGDMIKEIVEAEVKEEMAEKEDEAIEQLAAELKEALTVMSKEILSLKSEIKTKSESKEESVTKLSTESDSYEFKNLKKFNLI